ncbi:MAG: nucleotidyltransferase domain-containing protein [archaeon]|nr:nucleotidyltransferase domain-containing protein [archaeon]
MNNQVRMEKSLDEFMEKLRDKLGDNLVSVVLFGSSAREEWDERSDLDLLIIVEEYEEMESILIDTCVGIVLDYGVSIAPIIWDVEDLNANITYKSPLFLTLLLGYKIIYDRGNFFRDKIREIKKGDIPEFTFVGRHKEWRSSEISL